MTRDNAFRIALATAAILLLMLFQNLINLKRVRRARQAILPAVSAVLAIAAMVLLVVERKYVALISSSFSFFQNADIVLLNAVLYVAVLIVKGIVLPIVSGIWKQNALTERTSSRFYHLDEYHNEWFLSKKWVDARSILKAVMIGIGLCTGLILGLTWIKGPGSSMWVFVFPAAALIVTGEVFSFLNGQTKEEFSHQVTGAEADSRKVRNYYKIREIYERLFSENVLASHTGSEFAARTGSTQTLNELLSSEDPLKRDVANYFNTYGDKRLFDNDCVQATVKLLQGRSVVFFDPFYRDLTPYLTLPVVSTLLNGKKCLIICGRSSTSEDAVGWLEDTLKDYSHIRSLWRVKELGIGEPECEVGVLSFRQIFDVDVLIANKGFFERVGFILLLEPSVMVNTGQVGISVICEAASKYGDKPVFCICDRYTDGLVDTMSHLLKVELTDVVAAPTPKNVYTGMAWSADGDYMRQDLFDRQTRFLGNGVELASVAVKNQVPYVAWYGEKKAPLRDIRWIAGQYYSTICRYMGVPSHQKMLYERIKFIPTLWTNPAERDQFILVEDEFCNLFSTMRTFLSRGSEHSFVNILSENYLLRDYMRCNQQMFRTNSNAVPSLVPDYAKTERNTVLKLIVKMAIAPVAEEEILNELLLVDCRVEDVLDSFSSLMLKYTGIDGSILEIHSTSENSALRSIHKVNYYSISRADFDENFAKTLKNAYYIVEDEKRETEYIDAKMFGHVAQTILPGQFVTYFGKYYQVKTLSPESGVILRRASDLYTGRKYYRQLRQYHFGEEGWNDVKYSRTVMDVEVSLICCNFNVTTSGYLDMDDIHDLRLARVVSYEGDPNSEAYNREFKNKNVLRIKLPDTDDKIRFTMCILLSELFHTVFPDAWQYLSVLTVRPSDIEGMLNYMVYNVDGNLSEEYIYIVEDSDLDLGLLDAVNRNLSKLFEILCDFLDWHFEKMREPERLDPVPEKIKMPAEAEKRRNLFLKIADRIRRLFAGRKEGDTPPLEKPETVEAAVEEPLATESEFSETSEPAGTSEYELDGGEELQHVTFSPEAVDDRGGDYDLEESEGEKKESGTDHAAPAVFESEEEESHPEDLLPDDSEDAADLVHVDGTDIFEEEGMPEDNLWLEDAFLAAGIPAPEKSRYQRECYLKFGFAEIDGRLAIEDLHRYLHVRGYADNSLTLARKGGNIANDGGLRTEDHCDFCGRSLSGVSYERLVDGRVRCNDCSSSAITTVEEFQELFYKSLELMEMFYEVSFHVPISIKMADARAVAKGSGSVFKPSTQFANRTLGYAQRKHGKYSVIMENGSPRLATLDTVVHELTHIWQYINWNESTVRQVYGMGKSECTAKARSIVYEGMAMWATVQFLYQIGETYYASQQEEEAASRSDIYGVGFRLYREQYPLVKDMSIIKFSPYKDFPTIDPVKVKAAVRAQCGNDPCVC